MAKLKNPLFSLDAHGSLGKAISFVKRKVGSVAIKRPQPPDARTLAQLSWRNMYQQCSALWHTLSESEKAIWESLARPFHMTGFAYWQSQCLRPNPGIYLPLAGGTMSGAINMASQQVSSLPAPAADNDSARKKYVDDQITARLYTQGCRLTHSVDQLIPPGINTALHFDTQIYDTDNLHELIIDDRKITIQTPGIYLLTALVDIDCDTPVLENLMIKYWGGLTLAEEYKNGGPAGIMALSATTIMSLTPGQQLAVYIFQDSVGNQTVYAAGDYTPIFAAQRIG